MNAEKLHEALTRAEPVTKGSPTHQSHGEVLLCEEQGQGWLYASNPPLVYGARLPEVPCEEEVLVHAETLREWVKYAEGEIDLRADIPHLVASDGASEATIGGVPTGAMPKIPGCAADPLVTFEEASNLQEILRDLEATVHDNKAKAHFCSIHLRIDDRGEYAESTSGHYCSVVDLSEREGVQVCGTGDLILSDSFFDLIHERPGSERVHVGAGATRVSVWGAGWEASLPKETKPFADLESVIFAQSGILHEEPWLVDASEILQVARQSRQFTDPKTNRVYVSFGDEGSKIGFGVREGDRGSYEGYVDVHNPGEATEVLVGANIDKLIKLLRKPEGDTLYLYVKSDRDPICIMGEGEGRWVLMPMRVQ